MVNVRTIHCGVGGQGGDHIGDTPLLLEGRGVLRRGRGRTLLGWLLVQLLVVEFLLADGGSDDAGALLRLDRGGAGDERVPVAGRLHRLVDRDGGDLPRVVAGVVAGVQHRGGGGHRVLADLGLKTFLLK